MQESRQSPIMKESILGSAGGYGVGSHVTYEVSIFLLDLLREIDLYVCIQLRRDSQLSLVSHFTLQVTFA